MDLENVATVPEMIACPKPGCMVPAGVVGRFVLASTDGPVEHVKTSCLEGHGFTVQVETLTSWPLPRAPRPAETSG